MRLIPVVMTLAFLAGCGAGARDEAPRGELLAGAGAAVEKPRDTFAADTDPAAPAVTAGWLATFADSQLDALVAEAVVGNRDLAGAGARLDQAQSRARQAGADLGPTIGFAAEGQASGSSTSSTGTQGGAGLALSWELDVWGRVASGVASQQAALQATALDFAWARESLAANVARGLFFARLCAVQEVLGQKTLAEFERLAAIAHAKEKIGKAAADEVARADAAAAESKQRLTGATAAREEAVRSLEVLLGRYPEAKLDVGAVLPVVPPPPPAGLPSQLLERRPDLVAATRRVAAAFNQVESAKAARLPRLSITATGGVASGEFQGINAQGAFWSLAGNLMGPIYDGGRLKEQVVIEKGKQQEALAAYAQTALQAFQQVENGLGTGARLSQRREQISTSLKAREQALKAAFAKRTIGQVSDDAVVAATLDQLQTQALDLAIQHDQLGARVSLYLALGGGFEAPPATPDDTAPASKAITKP